MTHEPECWWLIGDNLAAFDGDTCDDCQRIRAAYQRGREDAAKAVNEEAERFSWTARAQETEEDGDLNWRVMPVLYAYGAACGECEHRFVMHYADKAGQCDKCGTIDTDLDETEVWHEGGIIEQMYNEANIAAARGDSPEEQAFKELIRHSQEIGLYEDNEQ